MTIKHAMKKAYRSSETTGAPLSSAIEVNGFVFVSGQVHLNSKGELAGETTEEKFDITISNIKVILAEAELTLDDVVKVNLYLTDLSELPALNKVYPKYFKHPLPARAAVGVTALPLGASLEVEVIAVTDKL